ncbi:hypothetical protein [Rathayibacter sp. VKM Ac-2754]|uniref:hypothetical protein n=1 Tax=Rathayibacter sp. VKM Ac-2754 TaxID=2609251 RepID=UPI00135B3434|nr:hypothetical protein [Rathayibacter sp. VKM Ac-2754]MWV57436.1 hypothetical protein [Rathayibacter sp. VKM Ac-2754]
MSQNYEIVALDILSETIDHHSLDLVVNDQHRGDVHAAVDYMIEQALRAEVVDPAEAHSPSVRDLLVDRLVGLQAAVL